METKNLQIAKGGTNYHKEQCDSIPEEINLSQHGIHLEPCYKTFVLIVSQEKSSLEKEQQSLISSRPNRQLSNNSCARNIYGKDCQFCKRYPV